MPARLDGRLILVVCFDIILHFPVCLCVCWFIIFLENQKRRSVCTTVTPLCSQLADSLCKKKMKERKKHAAAIEHCVANRRSAWVFSGHRRQTWRKGKRGERAGARARGEWEKKRRGELGGSSEAPSPDPRSRAGIKVACFMWLVRDFEVPESPTALTSSSSLVS